jgi:hypothetical protein
MINSQHTINYCNKIFKVYLKFKSHCNISMICFNNEQLSDLEPNS